MGKVHIYTQILQGNALFLGKIYTVENIFTRPPVVTVATNFKSDCTQLPVKEQHLRKGSVSRCRTLRGKPSGNSSPGGTYRIMQNFIMMKTILKARRILCCYKLTTSESSKFSRSPSTSSRSSVDLLKRQDFEIFQFF